MTPATRIGWLFAKSSSCSIGARPREGKDRKLYQRALRRRRRARAAPACLGALAALALAVPAAAQREAEDLAEIRAAIEALESRIARQSDRRDEGARALRRLETEIAGAARELERVRNALAEEREALAALAAEKAETERRLEGEETALGEAIRSSYMTGREALVKLLLSQESPADLGRMLVYYDYLNRARAGRIAQVNAALVRLADIAAETRAAETELARLERRQVEALDRLEATRVERKALLDELDDQIRESGSEIDRLRAEEARLVDLLRELDEVLAAFPVDADEPFSALRGSLAWPVEGRLVGADGAPLDGATPANGVVLEAQRGSPVRSIYHGRVVFSDWFQGFGLLLIVDHGEGFMSLYGYNEALLKDSGDWVEPGEVVAQVGDTGGQRQASLFFALRREGDPLDPQDWMGAAP